MAWFEIDEPGRYMIGWREPGGRKRRKSFRRRDDARRFKSQIESKLDRGEYASLEDRKVPLGEYIDLVLGAGNLDESTLGIYGYRRKHIVDLERKPLGEVTTSDIRAALAAMETGAPTKAAVRKLLSKCFRVAVEEGILVKNPVSPIPIPRSERREIRVLAPGEIRALADAINPRYRAAVFLSAYGGLRAGEVGGLHQDHLDLLRGSVRVQEAVKLVRGRAVLGDPKTRSSKRTVAIPRFVCEELSRHLVTRNFSQASVSCDRVFTTPTGQLVSSKTLGQALRDCSFNGRWHDLRHTSVALAIQQGAHPKQIQTRLGHTNITTTLDTYGHLFPGLDEDLALRMDESYRDEREGKVVAL